AQDYGNVLLWERVGLTRTGLVVSASVENSAILGVETAGEVVVPDLSVRADGLQTIDAFVIAGAAAVALAGGKSISVAGAGVFARNRVAADTSAFVSGMREGGINVDAAEIVARDATRIDALAGGAAIAGSLGGGAAVSVGIGLAIAMNEVTNQTSASIRSVNDFNAASDVEVRASTTAAPLFTVGAPTVTAAELDDLTDERPDYDPDNEVEITEDSLRKEREDDLEIQTRLLGDLRANGLNIAADDVLRLAKSNDGEGWLLATKGGAYKLRLTAAGLEVSASTINSIAFAASLAGAFGLSNSVAIAGAGAYAENVINASTRAFITATDLEAGGDVDVIALNEAEISAMVIAASLSVAVGASNGIGASIGISIARNFMGKQRDGSNGLSLTEALVANARVQAGGDLTLRATSTQTIDALVVAGSAAIAGGGTAGVGIAGSGVWVENVIFADVKARIEGDRGPGVTPAIAAETITLEADNLSRISTLAGAVAVSAAFGGTAGVGVSIGVALARNTIGGTLEASIDNVARGVVARDGALRVAATDRAAIGVISAAAALAVAIGGTAGVAVAGGGAESTNIIVSTTRAHISRSTVTADVGAVDVLAVSEAEIRALVASIAFAIGGGTVGVGVALGISVARNFLGYAPGAATATLDTSQEVRSLTKGQRVLILEGVRRGDVYEYVGDNVVVRSGDPALELKQQDFSDTRVWKLVSITNPGAVVEAFVRDSVLTASGAVTVDARARQEIVAVVLAVSAAVSGGKVGVAVSGAGAGAENRIATTVRAFVDGSGPGRTDITASALRVTAADDSSIDAFTGAAAIAAAFGFVGVAVSVGVSVAINEIATDVSARIVAADSLNIGAGGVSVRALSPETASSAININAQVVPGVTLITAAQLDDASKTDTDRRGDPVEADVTGDRAILERLRARLVAGGAEVFGALRLTAVEQGRSWSAVDERGRSWNIRLEGGQFLASRASINAVSAAAALAVGLGAVGVGVAGAGAVALNAVLSTVRAEIVDTALVNTPGAVTVEALGRSEINAVILSAALAAAGGAVGVGVSIGIAVARNYIGYDVNGDRIAGSGAVTARIVDSRVNAGGVLRVEAQAAQSIRALTIAGSAALAGGKVGVAGAGAGASAVN
ncbi:MAG: hypothetical protein EA355_00320, partial [Rhodobacteraceae bacterium]